MIKSPFYGYSGVTTLSKVARTAKPSSPSGGCWSLQFCFRVTRLPIPEGTRRRFGESIRMENPWTPAKTPAAAQADTPSPIYRYPLQRTAGAAQGRNSRMRDGEIFLGREGIRIAGRAVPGQNEQIAAGIMGGGLAQLILEYSREPRQENIPWDEVKAVVLESHKKKICFVYPDRDYPSQLCSLVLQYKDDTYPHIVQAARYFAPYKVKEGVIRHSELMILWIFLGILVIAVLYAILNAPRS
jgi:hypothetical protein